MPSSRAIGVGAFVMGGLLLFAVGIFMIGERRMLFTSQIEAYSEFRHLSGLQNGASVRVSGMNAGEVIGIFVPRSPAGKFRVKFRFREDLHPLVRTDSVASIQTDGLVGNQFVQIEIGTEKAPPVPREGTIPGAEPFDLNAVLRQASDTVANVNETVTLLRTDIQGAIKVVTETAETAHQLVDDVGVDVRRISESGARMTGDVQEILSDIRNGKGSIGKLLKDDDLHTRVTRITQEAERTVQNVREASEHAKGAVSDARAAIAEFRSKDGPVQGLTTDLRQTLGFTREAMSDLADNAEALKRSFLFRGFFNRRGYFDLEDVSPAEYRTGALEAGGRAALRVWLGASVLFTTAPDGTDTLTDGGRARIDSVMSDFLRYRQDSPLVIEGYAAGPTNDVRFLRARARAGSVMQYLTSKYSLDPRRAGVMVMGSDAKGSPSGDSWDGVALALFVSKATLTQKVAGTR